MGFVKYVKAAFLNRWNLLLFLGAAGLAALAPGADITLPLVLAGEIGFLSLLATNDKFQRYVEAQAAAEARGRGSQSADMVMRRILNALPNHVAKRFDELSSRCRELRQLAAELRDPQSAGLPQPFEDMQLAGLDKLLWIYLRLLFTHFSLEKFLRDTNQQQIQADIDKLESQLAQLAQEPTDSQRERMQKAIEDNLETSRARLANFQKAHDNFELVQLEIDRLENKIRALSEMAVNRHEPEFISGQVDQVAASMVQTERTMSELRFLTGLETGEEEIPQLIRREANIARN